MRMRLYRVQPMNETFRDQQSTPIDLSGTREFASILCAG